MRRTRSSATRSATRAAIAGAARKIEAVYSYPHQNHATMEVMNATARWTPERCEVWTPTQNGEAALAAAAEAAGLPPAQCEVYKLHLGGGFGRRGAVHDWVRQAVAIAKEMPGTPVKLIWSREEDMLHGSYHPVTQCKMTAGLDAQGNVTGFQMRISGQSILAGVAPQNIKDGKDPVVFQGLNPPGTRSLARLRVPGNHDRSRDAQSARAAGVLARREPEPEHDLPRMLHRRSRARDRAGSAGLAAQAAGQQSEAPGRAQRRRRTAGWGTPAAPGVFRGLAVTMGFGSYVAACAEVSVSDDGVLKIHRIVAATDPGHAVNPQQIEAQVEGSFAYGLSAALYGECTVKDGRIEQTNFHTYVPLRMAEMPAVETVIVMPSGGFWGGVGEPTIAVAAPAVLNAIFAATGKRIRDLPLKNHSLKKA